MSRAMPDVAVLVVSDCPHQAGAERLMRDALVAAGLGEVDIRTTVVDTEQQAAELNFAGSPSFRIDGHDPFPTMGPPSLACRLYRTEAGLAGLPDRAGLLAALTST